MYLQDDHPIPEAVEYVRYAEDRGFEAVWQAESRLVREATVPMAAFLAQTARIRVGAGVVNNWTRNPAEYVAAACTCPILYSVGPDVRLMLDIFADGTS